MASILGQPGSGAEAHPYVLRRGHERGGNRGSASFEGSDAMAVLPKASPERPGGFRPARPADRKTMKRLSSRNDDGRLSTLDADIITLLQVDARRPNTEIASQLGVTEGTVRNRIGRMLKDEVLKFEVWADPLKIGYQTYAFIEIHVNPPDLESAAERLAQFPEIVFVGICTGSFDIHVAALFSSNEHMYEMITKRLNHVKGVLRTSTSSVMRILKREFQYPVPGASLNEKSQIAAMPTAASEMVGAHHLVPATTDAKGRAHATPGTR
jgi:Lrp/AsnC family transcriptional regulator, regulator for asnA, asnC and gidA